MITRMTVTICHMIEALCNFSCWSCIGMRRDKANKGQTISLNDECEKKGEVLRLIMHAFGFLNEYTREDRDIYVEINWENIKPGGKSYIS